MNPIVDFHVYLLPTWSQRPELQILKDQLRRWIAPLQDAAHRIQPGIRILPDSLRKISDPLAILGALPGLLAESTPEDLRNVIDQAQVNYAVALPLSPFSENPFIADACAQDPRLIQGAWIRNGTPNVDQEVRLWIERGAKILQIHPAQDGAGPESETFLAVLKIAQELQVPVLLQTGVIHSKVAFKDPELGRAELFAPWYKEFPEVKFVLTRMNLHQPLTAFDLAEEFPNLWLTTAWQPAEIIGEATRRIGAERILFGSDWPVIGHNVDVGIERILDCVRTEMISDADSQKILGLNAVQLLGLPCP